MKYYNFFPKVTLKSCPFCGSHASLQFDRRIIGHGESIDRVWVECEDCCSSSCYEFYYAGCLTQDHVDTVVDYWNQRVV